MWLSRLLWLTTPPAAWLWSRHVLGVVIQRSSSGSSPGFERVTYANSASRTHTVCSRSKPSISGGWIDENRAALRPPVGNKRVFRDGDFVIMVSRTQRPQDYHVDPGEEFFYQIEGDMVLKTMQDGRPVDVPIREGEILLLPLSYRTLHNGAPIRWGW